MVFEAARELVAEDVIILVTTTDQFVSKETVVLGLSLAANQLVSEEAIVLCLSSQVGLHISSLNAGPGSSYLGRALGELAVTEATTIERRVVGDGSGSLVRVALDFIRGNIVLGEGGSGTKRQS